MEVWEEGGVHLVRGGEREKSGRWDREGSACCTMGEGDKSAMLSAGYYTGLWRDGGMEGWRDEGREAGREGAAAAAGASGPHSRVPADSAEMHIKTEQPEAARAAVHKSSSFVKRNHHGDQILAAPTHCSWWRLGGGGIALPEPTACGAVQPDRLIDRQTKTSGWTERQADR